MRCKGVREGKAVDEIRYYVFAERTDRCDTSLRTATTGLLQHVRDRSSMENSWHGPRDTQLREDAHRYRESNGLRIMTTLRSLATLSHDIRGLLALGGWREPPQALSPA